MRYRHGACNPSEEEGDIEEMTVAIISGREGVGKTTQILGVANASPSVMWAILELKDKKKLKHYANKNFEVQTLYTIYPREHKNAMKVDPVATLECVLDWKDAILSLDNPPKTIVIDGISDLRDYAFDAWLIKHNEETGENITSIQYKDWGAWGDINSIIKGILEPLINLGLEEDINILMTAQMKEDFVNDAKIGYKPDIKEWMSYPVQCLFVLSKEKDIYSVECLKEPDNPSWIVDELEKDTGLLKALVSHGLIDTNEHIKKAIAKKIEYMVRFTLEGESKKEFITAVSVEEAEATLKATYEKAENVEVIE